MSRKYIAQVNDHNFVYPNNLIYEYDTEIVHDINDNSVSGVTNSFTISGLTSTGLTVNYDLTWYKNNAEMYQLFNGDYSLVSIHIMPAGELYYTPWKMITNLTVPSSFTGTSQNFTGSTSVTNSDLQISGFTSGDYYFSIRFIGHRAIYPLCAKVSGLLPTPTPTPTPTVTPTNTPTPTPTVTNTPTPTPTLVCAQCNNWDYNNVPVGGDIIYYTRCSDLAPQTLAVSEGQTGSFCNCDTSGNPTTDNGTQLTQVGSCP